MPQTHDAYLQYNSEQLWIFMSPDQALARICRAVHHRAPHSKHFCNVEVFLLVGSNLMFCRVFKEKKKKRRKLPTFVWIISFSCGGSIVKGCPGSTSGRFLLILFLKALFSIWQCVLPGACPWLSGSVTRGH